MAIKLFHCDIYLPEVIHSQNRFNRVRLVNDRFTGGQLVYSPHALAAAANDRYGSFAHLLPKYFDVKRAQLVEVEVDFTNWAVVKRVYRQRLDDRRDLVLAVMPNWVVKTVWLNVHGDSHSTLDASKYEQRPKNMAA